MSVTDPGKQARIEEFLRKSLLGEELTNTQFHLYSARSVSSGHIVKPRVLCANNVLLAKSSKYFLDLLSSDISPSDTSLVDLTDDNDMPSHLAMDEYGYASDSDIEDDDDEPSILVGAPKDRPAMLLSTSSPEPLVASQSKDDDELSDDGSESVSSDMFVMSPEHPKMEEPFTMNVVTNSTRSVASSETVIQEKTTKHSKTAVRLRSLGSRHILVKDTAFQTWYTLLNYLYTGKISFLPLGSATSGGQSCVSSTNSIDEPKCSAKSMYRLASKVGLDQLRDEALAYIRSNLSEHNILKELSCSLVSKHSELLEMELDMLYTHIASPPVVTGFPALAWRIALKGLPHGADIIIGFHTRMLKAREHVPWTPTPGGLMIPMPESPSRPVHSPRSSSPALVPSIRAASPSRPVSPLRFALPPGSISPGPVHEPMPVHLVFESPQHSLLPMRGEPQLPHTPPPSSPKDYEPLNTIYGFALPVAIPPSLSLHDGLPDGAAPAPASIDWGVECPTVMVETGLPCEEADDGWGAPVKKGKEPVPAGASGGKKKKKR